VSWIFQKRAVFLLTAWMALPAFPASPPSDLGRVVEVIRSGVQPHHSMDFMRHVYATDRWFTFPKFQETAEYLRRTMGEIGLKNVELLSAPADGTTQVGFWTEPLAWDAKSAHLEILDPPIPASDRILADYQRIPTSLGMWSGPTPPEGTTAEVVEVHGADAAAIAKMTLQGKFVLTDHNPADFKWRW
jgi:hypothetical protein